jgi:hypothetical protein
MLLAPSERGAAPTAPALEAIVSALGFADDDSMDAITYAGASASSHVCGGPNIRNIRGDFQNAVCVCVCMLGRL